MLLLHVNTLEPACRKTLYIHKVLGTFSLVAYVAWRFLKNWSALRKWGSRDNERYNSYGNERRSREEPRRETNLKLQYNGCMEVISS